MAFFIEGSSSDSNITDEDRENLKKLDDVAEKMKNLDEGLEKINNTTTEIENLKTGKADVNHTHQYADIENTPNLDDYASKEYVNQEIAKVETVKGEKGDKGDPGEKGADGITPTLRIGNTTTLESGNNASVTMTDNNNVYTINFSIPKGEKGETGAPGTPGEKGDKGQDGTFDIDATYTQLVTTDKTVLGAINEVFTSASNGKKLIAQAITGKGVETSETDTFSTMAQNISNIPSGSGSEVSQGDLDFLNSVKNRRNLAYLFSGDTRSNITTMFDTSNVTSTESMFENNKNLMNISQFDTSNVTDMANMFYGCSNLTTVPQFNTSKVTNMSYMFRDCTRLTTIPLLDTTKVTNMNNIFTSCYNLTTLRFNPNAGNMVNFNLSHCDKMTSEDLTGMINSLPTVTRQIAISMGSTLSSRITEEAMNTLLTKGYTVT